MSLQRRMSFGWCLLLLRLAALSAAARAQAPPSAADTLQVTTQLVLVDVSVETKRTGKPVMGLGASDFEVAEDGKPQAISSVSQDTLPLSLVFLFDLTDTVHPVLQHLADGAAGILRHLRPQDEVAVMTFSSHAELEQRFTRDRMTAVEGIDSASASYAPGEPTFLFEDLWEAAAVSESSRLPEARRVQVWVSDGSANDQDLQRGLAHRAPPTLHAEAEATAAMLRSGVVVSALLEHSTLHGSGRFGDLERIAALTGGPVLSAAGSDAAAQFGTLLDGLRARYTLGYKPTDTEPHRAVHRLKVGLTASFWAAHPEWRPRDLVVRARSTYVR